MRRRVLVTAFLVFVRPGGSMRLARTTNTPHEADRHAGGDAHGLVR